MDTNLLSKFDTIEVNNNTRISAEDQAFCEDQEQQYKESIKIQLDFLKSFKEVSGIDLLAEKYTNQNSKNKYLDWYKFDKIAELAKATKEKFIHEIIWYFEKQYNVTINSENMGKKYGFDINYNDILDYIFIQLEGFTFQEKAVKEIKDKLKDKVMRSYDNKIDVLIKNKKVIFPNYFYIDSWDKKWGELKISYGAYKNFDILLTALSHYEQETTHNIYQGIYRTITNETGGRVFKDHCLMCIKAERIKIFKNGKVEITFLTPEFAQQFAKEYCGYLPEQKTA